MIASTETPTYVESEIEDHHADLDKWIMSIETLPTTENRRGVNERFIRDCRILKEDLNNKETPTAADLVDFSDRRNSLETQYHNIMSDIKK